MTIKEANELDIVAYLSTIGIEASAIKGDNYWYSSPFRNERTPSFKVDRIRNQWYDFGEGKGGCLIDLIFQMESLSIPEILIKLSGKGNAIPHRSNQLKTRHGIEILEVKAITSAALIHYYKSRRIAARVADHYLREVHYRNNEKIFYALGFPNDNGGYELRSLFFKGSSRPKAPTWIKNNSNQLCAFEGSFDFLSYLTIHLDQPHPVCDFLILNSTSYFEKQLPFMQLYRGVHLFLDNDASGSKCTDKALQSSPNRFVDERHLYKGYVDLNAWHKEFGTGRRQ